MQVDPITVEIVKGALKAAGREMGLLIERTAMSAFIREKKDFFAGVYDTAGHLVYTDHDKFGPGMVDCVLEVYPTSMMAPGDVYWFSDGYLSREAISHSPSPDMCFIAPAFAQGTLIGFAAAFGHFWDIGGMKPGTLSPLATEIFHEGLAIPPIKICDRGTCNDEVYRLILRNSRFPDLLRGDTKAMMAARSLGQRRLEELCRRSGYFVINPGTPQEKTVAPFGDNVELQYGDMLRVVTSGGGGWGNPAARDPLLVLQDVKDGFVSVRSAQEEYGVVIEANIWKIDWRRTQEGRAAMSSSVPLFDRGALYERMEAARV